MKKKFRSFTDARKFVYSLKLKNEKDWKNYCKSGNKPDDIPSTPSRTFKKDWVSLGDWLGTGYVANQNRIYQGFVDARKHSHQLKLNYFKDWKNYCKSGNKPHDIPANPNIVYKKEWISWGDWLGTGNIGNQNKKFVSFTDARKFVRKLKISSQTEWVNKYCKSGNKPDNIPANAHHIYKKEWVSWGDFLGTKNIAPSDRQFRSFKDARKFVQKLKLKNREDWKEFVKSNEFPLDIPKDPTKSYKKEWVSWGDFLGTGSVQNQQKKFWSFEKAKKYVHQLGLKNTQDWRRYCKSTKKPEQIPAIAEIYYKNKGWKSMGDWLGTGAIANQTLSKNYLTFQDARTQARLFAKKYNIKTWDDWKKAVDEGKIPKNLPLDPRRVYSKKRKK